MSKHNEKLDLPGRRSQSSRVLIHHKKTKCCVFSQGFRSSTPEVESAFKKKKKKEHVATEIRPSRLKKDQVGRNALRSEPKTGQQMAGRLASLIVDWKGTSHDDLTLG